MSIPRLQAGLSLVLLAACNRYEHFNVAGYEQASFDNEADVLFVIDNSPSMSEETASLALNFSVFINTLTSTDEGAEQVTETLSDAVGNYVDYTQQRGRFLDYNLAITTTSVDYSGGDTDGIDPGEAGTFLGDPVVLAKGDPDVNDLFTANLLCDAAYWSTSSVPSDPGYECGSDPQGVITQEFLDCTCGFNEWDNAAGSGQEEPLEAALMALCRSVDDPPEVCFNELSPFQDSQTLANEGFYREQGTVVVVVVSDEGDNSRRLSQGDDEPDVYLEAFQDFSKPVKFVAIGPQWDGSSVSCVDTSVPTWSVERVESLANGSGGYYSSISDENCEPADFADELRKLGDLLQNLLTAFQLQSIPDITTITVYVDGEEIDRADPLDPDADITDTDQEYDNGWSYDSSRNAVVFWGDAVPGYNANVRIFYRPLAGKPRELPF